ncbi:phage portal protein [Sphingobium sp. Z007]|uniref:phage portal protein n=1 Tax=Sphingobium sp. Z007 TaxID=627495 RepID=UPI000B4A3ACF|nr:phage portal protein [Sphingobium sp. Z007]
MNWIDRTVGYLSPVAGMRRQAARKMLERTAPRARPGRRFMGKDRDFDTVSSNPNDGRPKRYVDRMTILRLIAENPFARKALNALLNSLIGWGITGAPTGPKVMRDHWAAWINACDYYNRHDLYGLQKLWAISMLRDGEVFIVQRLIKAPGIIPLRLQTYDKGMLAADKYGLNIERGIEYDDEGRAVAYHFYRGRKGYRWSSTETIRFPAEEVIHLFDSEWVGQTEGVSLFEPIVKRLGDVEEGIEAEVVKANIAACLVGFRYRPPAQEGEDPNIGIPVDEAQERAPIEEFVPGMIETLEDGEQITFSNPPKTGGINDLARIALLASAAGVGVTYEQMTGDLSNVNFSSYKAGALENKRFIGRLQYLTFIPICLNRVFGWFARTGWESGYLSKPAYPVKWTPPPFESIDREGDAMADILEMEAGLESRANLLNARGYDHDPMMEEIATARDLLNRLKLAFRGDPMVPGAASNSANGDANASDPNRMMMMAIARRLMSPR